MSGNETPQIMIIIAIRYCLEERYGDALIHLKTLAEKIPCPKAMKELNKVSDVIYYGGNIIPYLSLEKSPLIEVNRGGSTEFISKEELLGEIVRAKKALTIAMLYLIEDVGLDMPSFVESINKVRT
jgi:hypothetical protein